MTKFKKLWHDFKKKSACLACFLRYLEKLHCTKSGFVKYLHHFLPSFWSVPTFRHQWHVRRGHPYLEKDEMSIKHWKFIQVTSDTFANQVQEYSVKKVQLFYTTIESYEPFRRTTRLCGCVVAKVEHCYDFGSQPSIPILIRFNCT